MTSGPVGEERQAENRRDPMLKVWTGVQLKPSALGPSPVFQALEAQLGRDIQSNFAGLRYSTCLLSVSGQSSLV